jgi:antitoxin ParD1/3/4
MTLIARRRKVTLPAEQVEYVDELVAKGAYGSTSEVVDAGLRALQDRDAGIEEWLRDEVVPVYDAMQTDPGRAVGADEVVSALRARHVARLKSGKHGP